jgi:hypothetical protein
MNAVDLMRDPAVFGPEFSTPAWAPWRAFVGALSGLPPEDDAARELILQCTGRDTVPTTAAREGWMIVGRRGGKSRVAALLAVDAACFRQYRPAPGERLVVMVLAADKRQARVVFRYTRALLESVPMLARLITRVTREAIDLANGVSIEVHTASYRSTRGYSIVTVIADEVAFWHTDEHAAETDVEILNAVRPAMLTVPGSRLIALSSPYARRGELWRMYQRHFGKAESDILVWRAPTWTMNPLISRDSPVITRAYEDDEAAASAEFGAEFRRDIESLVPREVVDAAVVPGRIELPPLSGLHYKGVIDPSGGSVDSFTLCIAHQDAARNVVVLDAIREVKPPFSPEQVVGDFAALLRRYDITQVLGDRYAGEWPREAFRKQGIDYQLLPKPKSDLYRDLLPALNSGQVELLDHPRLINQLVGLERRTARGGRDSIDHAPNQHDDVANVCAAAVHATADALPPLFFS